VPKKEILIKKPLGKGLIPTLHGQYGGKGNRAAHHPHDGDGHGLVGPVQRDDLHGEGVLKKISFRLTNS
jgi:hypothetical protein